MTYIKFKITFVTTTFCYLLKKTSEFFFCTGIMSKLLKSISAKPFNFTNAVQYAVSPRIIDKPVCYVNGQWVTGSASTTIAVDDPCTGDIIG